MTAVLAVADADTGAVPDDPAVTVLATGSSTRVTSTTDTVVADALLGPLADNGGPTLTHALLAGSPAIDAGDPATAPATDQRGVVRPQGAAPDAGAYEAE